VPAGCSGSAGKTIAVCAEAAGDAVVAEAVCLELAGACARTVFLAASSQPAPIPAATARKSVLTPIAILECISSWYVGAAMRVNGFRPTGVVVHTTRGTTGVPSRKFGWPYVSSGRAGIPDSRIIQSIELSAFWLDELDLLELMSFTISGIGLCGFSVRSSFSVRSWTTSIHSGSGRI